MGSVEGGAVVGRRLTTLPTKATHEPTKATQYMKAVEGSVVLGGDPVVTLEGAVPLPKLYSTVTVFLHLLFLLSPLALQ